MRKAPSICQLNDERDVNYMSVWMGLLTSTDLWPYYFFLLTIDFWPKILVTGDFCDVEFNDSAQKFKIYYFIVKKSFIDY